MSKPTPLPRTRPRRDPLTVSVVVPAYNEGRTLAEVVRRIMAVALEDVALDVILVDDGSTDDTLLVARAIEQQHAGRVEVHAMPLNVGKGAAVRLGLARARGEVILLQDADLELSPEDYPALLAPFQRDDVDVVYGSRFLRASRDVPWRTLLANKALVVLTNALYRSRLTDVNTGFKVFRRDLVAGFDLRSARFDFEPELTARLLRAGVRIAEVPVGYAPRTPEQGKTIGMIDGIECAYALLKYRWLG